MSINGKLPRVTEILSYFHAYDAYPNEGYYMKRGTWVGECCDLLAMGESLSIETLAFGERLGIKPLARGEHAEERWIDYVISYQKLIVSHEFTSQFVRCLGVQEEMTNEIYRYVGHLDQRWLMVDGNEAIFDIKAALVIPAATGLQTAFYDLGRPFGKRRKRYAVHLRPNRPALLEQYTDNSHYDAARLLAQAYWAAKGFIG